MVGARFGHGWGIKLKFWWHGWGKFWARSGHKTEILVAWLGHGFRFMRVVRMWGCIYVMRLTFSDYKMILVTIQEFMLRIRSCPNHALCSNLSCPNHALCPTLPKIIRVFAQTTRQITKSEITNFSYKTPETSQKSDLRQTVIPHSILNCL